ncbi:MAG: 4-hydroxy-tetrahydrodipicolinate synthase [Actinomycetia bacterium]|nr:4-hydroxy-tetrahydrodipicolinate synthase [Actinomycetes bacterium]
MLKGSQVALSTPFKDGKVDEEAFHRLIDWNIDGGSAGLLVLGSTGEAATLTLAEHHRLTEIAVEFTAGRVPLVVGAGAASTEQTVAHVRHAADAGADAVLVVAPYYTKPNQRGLIEHFTAVSQASPCPVIVYNNPGRCIVDIAVDTVARLAELPNIIGLKESNPDVRRFIQLRERLPKGEFLLVSGDEPTGLAFMAYGADCIYSVAGNILPGAMAQLHTYWDEGDAHAATKAHLDLMPLVHALYCDSNPVPLKYALSLMGLGSAEVRLPLVGLTEDKREMVRTALREAGALA